MQKMGFSENETDLYISLLKTGEATIAECIQLSNVKRATAYNVMQRLIESGLVIEIQGSPKKFTPAPPKTAFEEYQKQKLKELDAIRKEIPNTVEQLIDKCEDLFKEHPIIVDDRREFMLLRGPKMMDEIMIPLAKKVENCERIISKFPLAFPDDADNLEQRSFSNSKKKLHILFEIGMLENPSFLRMIACDLNDPQISLRHMITLPIKLVIFDDFAAVVTSPNNSETDRFESFLTFNRNVVKFYIDAFDSYWEKAQGLNPKDIEKYSKRG